jgi:hypothetical protein
LAPDKVRFEILGQYYNLLSHTPILRWALATVPPADFTHKVSLCVVRMRVRRTKEYIARRTAEGKPKREIMRCLKRYIVREGYRALVSPPASSSSVGAKPRSSDIGTIIA